MTGQRRWMTVAGWALVVLISGMLMFSASMKFSAEKFFTEQWVDKFGWPLGVARVIGVTELACAVIFLIPRTTVLGAILVTGYLGGAIATHVRVGDMFVPPALLGVFAWLSVYLREPRLRALVPLRL